MATGECGEQNESDDETKEEAEPAKEGGGVTGMEMEATNSASLFLGHTYAARGWGNTAIKMNSMTIKVNVSCQVPAEGGGRGVVAPPAPPAESILSLRLMALDAPPIQSTEMASN